MGWIRWQNFSFCQLLKVMILGVTTLPSSAVSGSLGWGCGDQLKMTFSLKNCSFSVSFFSYFPFFSSGTIRNPFSRKINKLSVSIFFSAPKKNEVWGVALLILLTAVLFGLLISAKRVQTRRRLQWLQKQRTTGHRYVGPKSQFESSSKKCLEKLPLYKWKNNNCFGVYFYKMNLSFCLNKHFKISMKKSMVVDFVAPQAWTMKRCCFSSRFVGGGDAYGGASGAHVERWDELDWNMLKWQVLHQGECDLAWKFIELCGVIRWFRLI